MPQFNALAGCVIAMRVRMRRGRLLRRALEESEPGNQLELAMHGGHQPDEGCEYGYA